jgi:hypothetical protein
MTDELLVRVGIGEAVLHGRLWDISTARDLLTLLPLTSSSVISTR